MIKMRWKIYRFNYDKILFSQSRFVKGNNSLKEPRAHYKVKIFVYEKFTELITTSSFLR